MEDQEIREVLFGECVKYYFVLYMIFDLNFDVCFCKMVEVNVKVVLEEMMMEVELEVVLIIIIIIIYIYLRYVDIILVVISELLL